MFIVRRTFPDWNRIWDQRHRSEPQILSSYIQNVIYTVIFSFPINTVNCVFNIYIHLKIIFTSIMQASLVLSWNPAHSPRRLSVSTENMNTLMNERENSPLVLNSPQTFNCNAQSLAGGWRPEPIFVGGGGKGISVAPPPISNGKTILMKAVGVQTWCFLFSSLRLQWGLTQMFWIQLSLS